MTPATIEEAQQMLRGAKGRLMLVGGKFGPPVFDIAEVLGKEETVSRINYALTQLPEH